MSSLSPKTVLRRLGLRPRKALGQHFLVHPHQGRRIVEALELTGAEVVVEIGPGLGALTTWLVAASRRVVALECDPALARYLKDELFPSDPRLTVICQDVLTFPFPDLCREEGQPLALAGNLPYQITSPLLFKMVGERAALSRAVLMMQQEVGARLLAAPGGKDYGILSVLMQYHFDLRRLFSLTPANFYPPPQVDSVVLSLQPASRAPAVRDEGLFTRVVKTAFGQRRKTLANALAAQAPALGLTREELLAILKEQAIEPARRGETLSVAEYVALSNAILACINLPT